jgi:hypothetical protein
MRRRVWALVLGLLAAACGEDVACLCTLPGDPLPPLARAGVQRQRFQDVVGDDYSYTFQLSCFCTPEAVQPVRITVRNGVITSATMLESGAPATPPADGFRTVPQLFDRIEAAMRDLEKGVVDDVRVEYDAALGYPREFYLDPEQGLADDELSYLLRDLTRE